MLCKNIILGCAYLISCSAFSQVIDNNASFRMGAVINHIQLQYENDYFSGTDEYYTQGINLEIVSPFVKKNPLTHLLLIKKENTNRFGIALEHNAYTPTSISSNKILFNDRPFAAALMIKIFGASVNPSRRQRLSSALSLGMIGSAAGGHEIQRTIHRWINDTDPQGWQYQIKNDLIINYEASIEKNILHSNYFVFNGIAAARMGTLNTKVSLGSTIMLGKLNSAITSAFCGKEKSAQSQKFGVHIYVQPLVNMVLYDATLQGGIIFNRDSRYTLKQNEIKHITFQGNAGVIINIRSFYIEYFQSIITKEFTTSHTHRWGGLRIGMSF